MYKNVLDLKDSGMERVRQRRGSFGKVEEEEKFHRQRYSGPLQGVVSI